MHKVMIFNPSTLEQMEVEESIANRHTENGWVRLGGENILVHMFHPGYNKNVNVLKADQATWESKGFYAEPTVVYSQTEGTQTVSKKEAQKLYGHGWYDTPANFPGAVSTNDMVEAAVAASKPHGGKKKEAA